MELTFRDLPKRKSMNKSQIKNDPLKHKPTNGAINRVMNILKRVSDNDILRIENLKTIEIHVIDKNEDNKHMFFSCSTSESFSLISLTQREPYIKTFDEDNSSISSDSDSGEEFDIDILISESKKSKDSDKIVETLS